MLILLSKNKKIIKNYLQPHLNIGFIATASELEKNRDYMYQDREDLVQMNYKVIDIDVSKENKQDILKKFKLVDSIFVAGGNSFYLLQQLKNKDVLQELKKFANNKIYIGSSAGACITCPSIEYAQKLDDKDQACPTYKTEGCFYLDYRTKKELLIDYIGKGWDGSCLSHGSACHESFIIPWEDILFLNNSNCRQYRKKEVSQSEYDVLRTMRINELVKKGITQREIAEKSIPRQYEGINSAIFGQVIDEVIFPMYTAEETQRNYKEYIPIVQVENGKILVPEIILPERLKFKGKIVKNEER